MANNFSQPVTLVFALAICLCGCSASQTVSPTEKKEKPKPSVSQATRLKHIDMALSKAARFMLARQSPDGAWRSETYGCFKSGSELTPLVLNALFFTPQAGEGALDSFRKGINFMVAMVDPDGKILPGDHGLNFPVYTSATASWLILKENKSKEHLHAQDAWLAFLRDRQLNESLGWGPNDPEFGGWGYSQDLPKKPGPGQAKGAFFESNLSATIFGIGALSSAGIERDDPAWPAALTFVKKCQNFSNDPDKADPQFDDGGFFFMPADALQNKAGLAGKDRFGRVRYNSYGTMTGDGLRALLQCGLKPDHPRVVAAKKWLQKNFSLKTNPGTFEKNREELREATYYYYIWSIAHALTRLGIVELETRQGKIKWAELMADELVKRQKSNGSWVNRFTDAKEDDPLVSTPWAVTALVICRQVIKNPGSDDYPKLTGNHED
ncbi:MAG: hypothetical protein JRJ87_14450 [Deltaproteobacteria bacterium]|nr:hypothetical protein [Deltaproteobacteria bacterium]